jgi:hypothetical protein
VQPASYLLAARQFQDVTHTTIKEKKKPSVPVLLVID